MKPCTEPSVQAYTRLVRSSEALHAFVSRGLAARGITASQFSAMKVLRIHGKLAQRDIAKFTLKTGGNITVIVDNMESTGLVTRDRDTKDRRVTYVRLTPEGEAVFDHLYPLHLDRIREAMSAFSEAECELLIELLEKLSPEQTEIACAPPAPLASLK